MDQVSLANRIRRYIVIMNENGSDINPINDEIDTEIVLNEVWSHFGGEIDDNDDDDVELVNIIIEEVYGL